MWGKYIKESVDSWILLVYSHLALWYQFRVYFLPPILSNLKLLQRKNLIVFYDRPLLATHVIFPMCGLRRRAWECLPVSKGLVVDARRSWKGLWSVPGSGGVLGGRSGGSRREQSTLARGFNFHLSWVWSNFRMICSFLTETGHC